MSAKWATWPAAVIGGIAVAAAVLLVGVAPSGAAQPSIPTPPSGAPSIDFPLPSRPSGGTGTPQPAPGPTSGARPRPLLPQSVNIALKVERDGRLSVAETAFVQARSTMTRRVPLRIQAGDGRDRVFTIRDVSVDGNGRTEFTGDEFVIRFGEGAATVKYTVDGSVLDLGDRQEARWQVAGGWDVPVRVLRASFIAPQPPQGVACLAGALGSTSPCQSAITDHGQVLRVVQENLAAGNRVDLSVGLPRGTVAASARFEGAAPKAAAFAMTPVSGAGLGALAVLVLGGFLLLWLARGRDARALAAEVGPVDVLLRDGDRVAFASPDGVLPGQIGTVVDERVDPADVAATVVDLAVRNYLWIAELTGGDQADDWRIVRRNPPDEALTAYEHAVVDAVLPGGAEQVRVSDMSTVDISAVRASLYADVVARKWFTRRPDRGAGRWTVAGAGLVVAGAAATVVLALTVGNALIGLCVVIGGIALAAGGRWMPARSRRGSVLLQQVRGLLSYLRTAEPRAIPDADRETALSRSLPFAVVLGDLEHWLAMVGPTVHWYGGRTANIPRFLAALTAKLR